MNVQFLSSTERKETLLKLKEQYGIENLNNYLLFRIGKDKIRAYSGTLTKDELARLGANVNVEIIGIYLLKEEREGLRLGHDAVSLLGDRIKKNIIEINDAKAEEWLSGKDIEISNEIYGYIILKNKNMFIGCGKASQGRVVNFAPKERRTK